MKGVLVILATLSLTACEPSRPTGAKDTTDSPFGCIASRQSIQPNSATLRPGDTLRLRIPPEVCNGVVYTAAYEWSSNNAAVAVVDRATALVTALAAGRATIIASAVNDPNDKSAMAVQVVP